MAGGMSETDPTNPSDSSSLGCSSLAAKGLCVCGVCVCCCVCCVLLCVCGVCLCVCCVCVCCVLCCCVCVVCCCCCVCVVCVLCVCCVCVLCVCVVCVWRQREEEAAEEEEPGIQNQKQEPHAKLWGIISCSSPISACQTKPTHAKRLVALLDGGEQSNSESNKATSTRKPLSSSFFHRTSTSKEIGQDGDRTNHCCFWKIWSIKFACSHCNFPTFTARTGKRSWQQCSNQKGGLAR